MPSRSADLARRPLRHAEGGGAEVDPDPCDNLVSGFALYPNLSHCFAGGTARGRQVTEACHYAGVRVPDQVAVLGGEFDDLMASISNPPLSTIDQPAEQIGYMAAEMLAGMMAGKKTPHQPVLFPPSRIIVRHSTSTLAIDDPLVGMKASK